MGLPQVVICGELCADSGCWSTKVDFQIVVQLISVHVCLQISCTTTKKLTLGLQNLGSGYMFGIL